MTRSKKEQVADWRRRNPEKWKAQCQRAADKRKANGYYKKNADTIFENYLKRTYKIDLEKYNSMLQEQDNVCAICKKECVTGKKLACDHDHKTGQVRGLLCANCNRGVGYLNDSIDNLEAAVLYLKRTSC